MCESTYFKIHIYAYLYVYEETLASPNICMHLYVYLYISVSTYKLFHSCTCKHIYINKNWILQIQACIYTYIYIHFCLYVCIRTCMFSSSNDYEKIPDLPNTSMYLYADLRLCMSIHMRIYVYVYLCMFVYLYTYRYVLDEIHNWPNTRMYSVHMYT